MLLPINLNSENVKPSVPKNFDAQLVSTDATDDDIGVCSTETLMHIY